MVETMWTTQSEKLTGTNGLRFALARDSRPATVSEVLGAWSSDEEFRSFFNSLLANAPFDAFRWETPAVMSTTLANPFEFVLLDSPSLARRPDPEAFADFFHDNASAVVSFTNLGGDAIMIVPCPVVEPSAYGHLAAFVRLAPEAQRQSLWKLVGESAVRRIGSKPIWLSTAGAGVSWLHVRLDDRPKYYGYTPYRKSA